MEIGIVVLTTFIGSKHKLKVVALVAYSLLTITPLMTRSDLEDSSLH
jgi:hypothetical protein